MDLNLGGCVPGCVGSDSLESVKEAPITATTGPFEGLSGVPPQVAFCP